MLREPLLNRLSLAAVKSLNRAAAQAKAAQKDAAAGHLLEFLATPRPDDTADYRHEAQDTAMARGEVLSMVDGAIEQFCRCPRRTAPATGFVGIMAAPYANR
jgi:hypothetical protein